MQLLVTKAEAATALGISIRQLELYVRNGKLLFAGSGDGACASSLCWLCLVRVERWYGSSESGDEVCRSQS
jgi:hypothetical protein